MKPLTNSQALTGFFLSARARRLSQHTIADYNNTLVTRCQSSLGVDCLVDQITSHHIEEFLANQTDVSKKTALNFHTGLSAFWSWAIREKVATEHIVRALPAPKPEQPDIVPYSEQDMRAMLNNLERSKRYVRPGSACLVIPCVT